MKAPHSLVAYRRSLEGRRSAVVWLIALTGVLAIAFAVNQLPDPRDSRTPVRVLGALIYAIVSLGTFFRLIRRRLVFMVLAPIALGAMAFFNEDIVPVGPLAVIAGSAFVLLMVTSEVPTRLFFREDVGTEALLTFWNQQGSNPMAVHASRIAMASLIIPGLGVIGAALAVNALGRVDSAATPPVGGRGIAIGSLVFSVLTSSAQICFFSERYFPSP